MESLKPSAQSGNTYLLNPENAAEMGRLILFDRMLTEAMGGLFSERSDLSSIHRVLDIGCGPGGWALNVARAFSHLDVVGIDVSELMIAYAQMQARREKVENLHFEVMNATRPLDIPDESFDLINIRSAVAFLPRNVWPGVLRECFRLLRPDGTLRLTETDHAGVTNSPAYEQFSYLCSCGLQRVGYGFAANNHTFGITPMLEKLLLDAGFLRIQSRPHIVNFSYQKPLHGSQTQNMLTGLKQGESFLLKLGLATPEELLRLSSALLEEMQMETFRGLQYWLTCWGEKPGEGVEVCVD